MARTTVNKMLRVRQLTRTATTAVVRCGGSASMVGVRPPKNNGGVAKVAFTEVGNKLGAYVLDLRHGVLLRIE